MKEKTMRYPGHIALMRVLRDTGLFGKEPVEVRTADGGRAQVRPLDVTSSLLFPKWTFEDGEEDLTVMRVSAVGVEDGRRVRLTWDLFDRYDPETRTRSMSRTTGFPATICARWLVEGRFRRPGVHPPETLGAEPALVAAMLQELEKRGVRYEARVEAA
jgi:saccharopine dehydrogenase-like NADP-dependent oxidoreductase